MTRSRITTLLCALWLALASPASGDWPHLRGPNYDAISPEAVVAWGEIGPPVLWKRELGQGYSGFVVADGRVYTQYQSRVGQYVLCLNATNGDEVWRTNVGWPWQPAGAYPGPYATPTFHAGHIFYTTPMAKVGCLDAATGRESWSIDLRQKFKGEGTGFGYAATPLIEDGKVILPVGGKGASIVALGVRDGSTVWAAGDDPASYCPIYPITLGGRRIGVAMLQNSMTGHDLATGDLLWREQLSKGYDEHSAWPLYSEPYLFTASAFRRGAQLYRLDRANTSTIKAAWVNQELSNDVCSSVLYKGHVYGFDLHQAQTSPHRASRGRFKCLEFATGAVRWETKSVGQCSPLIADDKLILLDDTGHLILARASPDEYAELARCRVFSEGQVWTPPTLRGGRLYLRDPSRMVCVYLGPPESLEPGQRMNVVARSWELDLRWLIGREPDFPHDAPRLEDVTRWFVWCVGGVFGVSGIIAGVVTLIAWRIKSKRVDVWAIGTFVIVAFILGVVGTRLYSDWADTFILTWPASLYVAFRATLAAGAWGDAKPLRWRRRLAARAALVLFVGLCFAYYQLCLAAGYVMAWGFLGGLLPAIPAALVAAYSRRRWLSLPAEVVAFAVYFSVSGLLPMTKDMWFS